ncbi:hypothetical protein ADIS_1571 [Lunatimonas lonarensis]|uniref:Uncharacterized protein n=1 Tax=Lunatimonas lonarensis TaxID=1232681 RepID=R7ZVC1_9BACT|nr:hypothetical protein [Lunatimonas lonarensis]EON78032.1 hypothetical protein ADIS_1571 [Lunatimonas lonarensis]
MKFYLAILILFFSQLPFGQKIDREIFDETLGSKKAQTYSMLEESFEKFLNLNYPDEKSLSKKMKRYLLDIHDQNFNWIFDNNLSSITLQQLESSGLRKDIMLYKNETYEERFPFEDYIEEKKPSTDKSEEIELNEYFEDIIEVPPTSRKEERRLRKEEFKRQKIRDKFPQPNKHGLFYYALAKSKKDNEDILAYLAGITKYGIRPSPSLIAYGFIENLTEEEFIKWENKLLVIVEVYLSSLIYNDIMKKIACG